MNKMKLFVIHTETERDIKSGRIRPKRKRKR